MRGRVNATVRFSDQTGQCSDTVILTRYLTREIADTLFAVLIVLLLIFMSNQFVRYLSATAEGKIALTTLLHLMTLELPHLLSLLLPLALYLAIMLAYGRHYADNEMTVLQASGVGLFQIFKMTAPFILAVMVVVGVLTLWLEPHIMAERNQLLAQMGDTTLQTILPGRFQASYDGRRVFYVENISVDRKNLHHLFMAESVENKLGNPIDAWTITVAKKGYQERALDENVFLVAADGHRYEGIPGEDRYRTLNFAQYALRADLPVSDTVSNNQDAKSTWALWHTRNNRQAMAELQWRIAMPVSALLLALLATPFSRIQPRYGKYARILPAILLYIIYANLLFISRTWMERGTVALALGMWWVHGLLIITILMAWWSADTGFGAWCKYQFRDYVKKWR